MTSYLVAIQGRWSVSVTMCWFPLTCLAIVLAVLSAWSTVVAHEKQGFVVLPNQAPRFSGPVGGEADTTEILATREQTGGSLGVWRYTKVLRVDHPCTSTARRMSSFTS